MNKLGLELKFLWVLMLCSLCCSGCMQGINRSLTHVAVKDSYYHGDYARSFRLAEALAHKGDVQSKYTLGYMHFYGIGAPANKSLGIAWIKQAAQADYEPAKMALDKISALHHDA